MATAIQRRRGTTAQTANFTGLAGEITIDTDLNTIIVHDGSTAGGYRLAKYSEVQSAAAGDIESVIAGNGLTGGASSGNANINVGAGAGISVSADAVAIDEAYFDQTAGGTGFAANFEPSANNTYSLGSATNVWKDVFVGPTSLNIGGTTLSVSSGQLQFGGSNVAVAGDAGANADIRGLFSASSGIDYDSGTGAFTADQGEVRGFFSAGGDLTYTAGTGEFSFTERTDAEVRGLVSATDAGGDGSFAYNSGTGVFTYTGPSASEVRAHFTAGTGVAISSGEISIGQAIGSGDSPSFTNLTVSGNLTVNGTQTIVNSTTVEVADDFFRVNSGGANVDAGFEANINGVLKTITYDVSEAHWTLGSEPLKSTGGFIGDVTGDVTGTVSSIANHDTGDLTEGANLYWTTARGNSAIDAYVTGGTGITVTSGEIATTITQYTDTDARSALSGGTGIAYNSSTGEIALSDTDLISGVTAGSGLTGGGASGNVTVNVVGGYGITVNADDIEVANSDIRGLFSAGGDLSYNSTTGEFSFTNDAGDIESVGAGNGLTGGGTSGAVTLNVVGGTGIVANADDIAIDFSEFDTDSITEGSTNLYYTSARAQADANTAIGNNTTDNLSEGSSNLYYTDVRWDTKMSAADTDDLSEGLTNLYYTSARANSDFDTRLATKDTGDLGEGSNLYYTDARARSAVSITDAGGDGSFAYDSGTGVFTYTGPSAAEVRAHLTAGDGLSVSSGEFSVDSSVVRTTGAQTVAGAKTFSDDIILSGNLTVNGTQTVLNTETLTVDDNIIVLNNNASGAPSQNAGIQVNRGSSADVTLQWNESGDRWQFTNDGSTFYNLVIDTDDLAEGSTNEYYTDTKVRNAISVGGDLAYNSGTGVISFTERTDSEVRGLFSGGTGITYDSGTGAISLSDTGYISGVTAGSGLTGGGTDGNVTVNAVGGYGITVNADDIEVANSDIRGLFSAGGDLSYNSTTGVVSFTERTDSEVRGLFSAGGDLSYNSGTGVISFTERTDSEVRGLFSASGDLSYDSSTGVFSFTNDAGDIEGVTAGTGLSGGGTSGTVTLSLDTSGVSAGTYGDSDSVAQVVVDAYGRVTAVSEVSIGITAGAVSGLAASATTDTTSASNISSGTLASARLPDLTVADFAGAAIQTGSESFSDSDTVLMTAAAVQDKILSYGYTTTTGDITGVTAGSGLTGGGSSGGVTLNVGAGSYITVAADTVAVDATSTNTASKVVARDGSGNFAAGTITATATNAQYADLAEKYEADEELEAGTVVCFGGDKEITACEVEGHHAVAGVISTDPAHLMNSECPGIALPVALAGRVPCKVVGPVNKGDLMIASSVKGHAKADNDAPAGRIIGKAIGSNEDGEGVVEVLVNMM